MIKSFIRRKLFVVICHIAGSKNHCLKFWRFFHVLGRLSLHWDYFAENDSKAS